MKHMRKLFGLLLALTMVLTMAACGGETPKETEPANGAQSEGVQSGGKIYDGVDECVIWGDYFFMEALTRLLNPHWNIYW